MPPFNIAILILMGLIFALWMFLMFRMLWRLTRQSLDALDASGGGYFAWVGHSLRAFGGFFSDPSVAAERRQLIWVTVLLLLIIVAQPVLFGMG
jgi:hypothetical protein